MNTFYDILTAPMTYVELALILFLSVFLSVLAREAFRPKREVTRMAGLPLEDEHSQPSKEGAP